MSERNTDILLSEIFNSIEKILSYTSGMSFEDYEADGKTRDAVERNFEIIGEAASRIHNEYKILHDEVEWRIIKDFRNHIIHNYAGIDNVIVWDIIQNRLTELKAKINAMIKNGK